MSQGTKCNSVKIIFDVDDTICNNIRKLRYEDCVPDLEVIDKINYLHDDLGFYVVLYTARGMISCNGEIDKIVTKNKRILEEWLKKYDVHYDELVFGKPLADLYVDDKALNVKDFKNEEFSILYGGGSNRPIYRLGNTVKKFVGSNNISNFKDWVEDNKGACYFPKVFSYLYDAVFMEYIEGRKLSDKLTIFDLLRVIKTVFGFAKMKRSSFDIKPQLEILEKNKSDDDEINSMIDMCSNFLIHNEDILKKNASYSHGDMILSNIIKSVDGKIYFIDSRYFRSSSSYLFDFAKLRNSISGYEYFFGLSRTYHRRFLFLLDRILKAKGIYDIVIGLNLMYVLRLYRYKNEAGKKMVKVIAKGIIERNEKLFKWDKED